MKKLKKPMALTMELMVNGESFSRTYNTTITPPDNILAAGNSYLFRAFSNHTFTCSMLYSPVMRKKEELQRKRREEDKIERK